MSPVHSHSLYLAGKTHSPGVEKPQACEPSSQFHVTLPPVVRGEARVLTPQSPRTELSRVGLLA